MKIDKRGAIIQAAKPLFAERGFEGVTSRDIAQATGFHLGSLHHFYPQKADLYEAVVVSAFADTTDVLVEALSDAGAANPEERFRHFFFACFAHMASDNADARLIDREYLDRAGRTVSETLMREMFTKMHGALHPVIAAITPGDRSEEEIHRITAFVFSLIFGAAKLDPLHGQMGLMATSGGGPTFVDQLCDFALTAIAAQATPQSRNAFTGRVRSIQP
jgi:AcrR family transcriptional regulator